MRLVAAAGFAAIAGIACQQGDSTPVGTVDVDLTMRLSSRPVGTYVVTEPSEHSLRFGPGPIHRILFMNRYGGTYSEGEDNSSLNSSIIPNGSGTVSAWSYGDAGWNQLMSCVRNIYSRFDIEVTDVDPGATPHIESVVGGTPGQVGQPNYVGGVAPVNYDCSVVERAVVYTFAGIYGGDIQSICETVAQESAHALGLDHEYLCQDPMTYLYGCGAKQFQDVNAQCGENGPRTCMCGGSTQNSVQVLLDVLGPATTDNENPAVDITSPANGAIVEPGFTVTAIASDDLGVQRIDLILDGASFATDTQGPYQFATPATLADGLHTIELRAYDAAGNMGIDSISVTVARADECAITCNVGEHCEGGVCVPDGPAPGETGSPCAGNEDCVSGMCGSDGSDRLCTASCASDVDCPAGFACLPSSGGSGVCWPNGENPADDPDSRFITGGCSVGGSSCPGCGVLPVLLLGLALLITRRRR